MSTLTAVIVYTTYLAGCTDPEYKDPTCPNKGKFSSQQWVWIAPCEHKTYEWAACKETADIDVKLPNCTCTPSNLLLTATTTLHFHGMLPDNPGGKITWDNDFTPTVSSNLPSKSTVNSTPTTVSKTTSPPTPSKTGTETVTSTPVSNSSSTLPLATSTSPDSSPVILGSSQPDSSKSTTSEPNLSASAQAGIGIGVGVGAVIVGGLIFLAFFLHKRNKEKHNSRMAPPNWGVLPPNPNGGNYLAPLPDANGGGMSDRKEAPFIPELAADEPKRTSTVDSNPSSSVPTSVPTSATGFLPQTHRLYTAYNPHLHGNYAVSLKSEKSRDLDPKAGEEAPVSPETPTIVVSEPADKPEQANEGAKEEEEQAKKGAKEKQQLQASRGSLSPIPENLHELSG
ncbi:hypothetical protein F5Y05DRAFT_378848 [Hypoxylon sp. FL0543]|nr:hypothetical protein F5Y05DRAFT_378848 [Hypoxylon sp. FL0543]